ncbi:class I SAM-dependent methyltransferase [Bacillus sp. MRMR6]|uniref:class I SAM-dependent methyltransferase n=1 Tax=Bacillus sp. MRMR6 TaxID=1928617 RepID=UPI000951BBA4|nr:class I SAM-dependent methyltransferase [Bacillus sp. MRMR6]OLS37860.1 SAM-dependent methyltransferase [Bacillus sp. MRMR6]
MNNKWNRLIYRLWSPVYDTFFNKGPFLRARKEVFKSLPFQKDDKILFVGVGTGADIELMPEQLLNIIAIDYSAEMLERAKEKFPSSPISFQQMDAQNLQYPDSSFDYVMASLILSVVPDSEKVFAEMIRVLRPGGQIVIFDKFSKKPSLLIKTIRPVIRILGTDIGLSFENTIKKQLTELEIVENQDVLFRGMYRKILIRKN